MTRSRTPTDMSRLSREERRRIRVGRRKVKGRPRVERPKRSREELLDYLRVHNCKSIFAFVKNRLPGDPIVWDFRHEFGSWSEAKLAAFGKEPFKAEITADYLMKLVVLNNLWTSRRYITAHQLRPDIIPSFYYVRREFKYWNNLVHGAKQHDLKRILDLYMRLHRRLGRAPTISECHANDIDIRRLIVLFGGKRFFEQNVKTMEEEYERRKRNHQSD